MKRHWAAFRILSMLFLVMSQSKIITRAQEVTTMTTSDQINATQQQAIAKVLSNVLAGVSLDLSVMAKNATAGTTASAAADPPGANAAEFLRGMPNLARLIDLTTNPNTTRQPLVNMLRQQQMTGEDMVPMEQAAGIVAQFLQTPKTYGNGQQIQNFVARVDQIRELKDKLKQYLHVDQLRMVESYLITAGQLGLGFLGAFPLAQLAYITAQLALIGAILGLLTAIFAQVSSSLALAASIAGPADAAAAAAGASAAGGKSAADLPGVEFTKLNLDLSQSTGSVSGSAASKATVIQLPWLNDLTDKANVILDPFIRLAFSNNTLAPLNMADTLLGWTDDALKALNLNLAPPGSTSR